MNLIKDIIVGFLLMVLTAFPLAYALINTISFDQFCEQAITDTDVEWCYDRGYRWN